MKRLSEAPWDAVRIVRSRYAYSNSMFASRVYTGNRLDQLHRSERKKHEDGCFALMSGLELDYNYFPEFRWVENTPNDMDARVFYLATGFAVRYTRWMRVKRWLKAFPYDPDDE